MTRLASTALRSAGAALVLSLSACGPSEPERSVPTPEQTAPDAAPGSTPNRATPDRATPDPAAAGPREAGPPGTDAELGRVSYATYCASCHGADGSAQTPMADALDPRPTAHNDGSYMNGLSNDYLFRIIQEGGAAVGKSPLMAPWGGSLSDDQIRQLVAYIRALAVPPYEPPTP